MAKVTLLESLTKALNKVYGNTITIEHDKDVSHVDRYVCNCGEIVPGEDWNEEYKCCKDCYMELAEDHNIPPFEGMDGGDVCCEK